MNLSSSLLNLSKNLFPFDFLMMGEGYHNNHHKNSCNANFGVKWHEIDITFLIIKVLDILGFIKLKKLTACL
jgi:stearoyl-CoA desaturase (Delta-9 desaturase)